MEVSMMLAFKAFVSATATAGLLDMYVVQLLKHFGGLPESFAEKSLRWATPRPVRRMLGDATLAYMKTRTFLFPLLELLFGSALAVSLYTLGPDLHFIRVVLFLILAIPLAVCDWQFMITPNLLTYPGILIGFLTSLALGPQGALDSLLGALTGGGSLWLVSWLWERARGVEGIGLGTVKAMAMIGAFSNWRLVLMTIFLFVISGSIFGLIVMLRRRESLDVFLPTEVFTLPAGFVALLWGEPIIAWYMSQLAKA